MGADQVEIVRIEMRFRRLAVSRRDTGPIQSDPGQAAGFDGLPLPEPMNPAFEPVMIRRNGDEAGDKTGQDQVAALEPIEFIQRNGGEQAGEKERQTPAGEVRARPGALRNATVDAGEQAAESR